MSPIRSFKGIDTAAFAITMLTLSYAAVTPAWAQTLPSGSPQTAAENSPITASPAANIVDIPAQAEAILAELKTLEESPDWMATTAADKGRLTVQIAEIELLRDETAQVELMARSVAVIRGLEAEWMRQRDAIIEWRSTLSMRGERLECETTKLVALGRHWREQLGRTQRSDLPELLRERVQLVLSTVERVKSLAERRQTETLALIDRLATPEARVTAGLSELEQVRQRAVRALPVRDGVPIWQLALTVDAADLERPSPIDSLRIQLNELVGYAVWLNGLIWLHVGLTCLLALVFSLFRYCRRLADHGHLSLRGHLAPLSQTVSSTLLISTSASPAIYPDAPVMYWATLGSGALVPALLIVRARVDPSLSGAAAFLIIYLAEQLRNAIDPLATGSRWLFIFEMFIALLYTIWLFRQPNLNSRPLAP